MRVCYFGTYRKEYNRNKIMIASMRAVGIEVIECHEKLWESIEDRVNVTKGGWLNPKFWWRVVKTYTRLITKFKTISDFNVLMTGYPGQFDIYLANFFAKKRKKPLVSDIFMSLYVIVHERKLEKARLSAVNILKFLEEHSYKKPILLIHDTQPYSDWISEHFEVPIKKIKLVPTGADENIFQPGSTKPFVSDKFTVLFYGTFIPNHGLDLVYQAMELLKAKEDIRYLFIGDGPEKASLVKNLAGAGIKNVEFIDWVDQKTLVEYINSADLSLGAFGATLQSMMTVHNKVYENMSCGKAFLTGESPAIKAQFENRQEIIYCERTPQAIAEAILEVRDNPDLREKLEKNARERFLRDYSFHAQGKRIESYLGEAIEMFRQGVRIE